jgi:hypothetical protein
MKTYKVEIDFKGHASFSCTTAAEDSADAVALVTRLAAANGFTGTIKKTTVREIIELAA